MCHRCSNKWCWWGLSTSQSVSLSHTNIASIFPLHLSKSFGGQYKWGSIQSITHTMVNLTVWCRRKKPTRMLIMTASFKRKLWMYYAFFPFSLSAVIGLVWSIFILCFWLLRSVSAALLFSSVMICVFLFPWWTILLSPCLLLVVFCKSPCSKVWKCFHRNQIYVGDGWGCTNYVLRTLALDLAMRNYWFCDEKLRILWWAIMVFIQFEVN